GYRRRTTASACRAAAPGPRWSTPTRWSTAAPAWATWAPSTPTSCPGTGCRTRRRCGYRRSAPSGCARPDTAPAERPGRVRSAGHLPQVPDKIARTRRFLDDRGDRIVVRDEVERVLAVCGDLLHQDAAALRHDHLRD